VVEMKERYRERETRRKEKEHRTRYPKKKKKTNQKKKNQKNLVSDHGHSSRIRNQSMRGVALVACLQF
jgi:hypothetical protein